MDMPPRLPCLYIPHVTAFDAVIGGDFAVQSLILNDRANLLLRQFCTAVSPAPRRYLLHPLGVVVGSHCPPAADLIRRVIGTGPPPQMRRVHTVRIIARMQGKHASRARPTVNRQRNMGGQIRPSIAVSTHPHSTIPSGVPTPNPRPTIVGFSDRHLSPEVGFAFGTQIGDNGFSHGVSPHVRGQGRALLTQRFRPVSYGRFMLCSQAWRPSA